MVLRLWHASNSLTVILLQLSFDSDEFKLIGFAMTCWLSSRQTLPDCLRKARWLSDKSSDGSAGDALRIVLEPWRSFERPGYYWVWLYRWCSPPNEALTLRSLLLHSWRLTFYLFAFIGGLLALHDVSIIHELKKQPKKHNMWSIKPLLSKAFYDYVGNIYNIYIIYNNTFYNVCLVQQKEWFYDTREVWSGFPKQVWRIF